MTELSAPRADPGGESEYECARAWSALTAAHARISGQLTDALSRGCGLTINDFEILLRVDRLAGHAEGQGRGQGPGREESRGLRLGELNTSVPLTQPTLSRAVARLADRGLLSRSGISADRRGVLVAITPAGREVLHRAVAVHAATIGDLLLSRLTPAEQDLLARALGRVAAEH